MFRDMRRKKQLLSETETIAILESCTSGVLAVTGDKGYPYTVPLSYAYKDKKLFFHFAKTGHKIDGIERNDKVTFCVIDKDEVVQKTFTIHYRSAVVFGRAKILTENSEKQYALEALLEKYSPDYFEEGQREIEDDWKNICVAKVEIEHMTGKAAMELLEK